MSTSKNLLLTGQMFVSFYTKKIFSFPINLTFGNILSFSMINSYNICIKHPYINQFCDRFTYNFCLDFKIILVLYIIKDSINCDVRWFDFLICWASPVWYLSTLLFNAYSTIIYYTNIPISKICTRKTTF